MEIKLNHGPLLYNSTHDLVVNKFCYMSQFWAKMSYLGGRLVPLVTLVF